MSTTSLVEKLGLVLVVAAGAVGCSFDPPPPLGDDVDAAIPGVCDPAANTGCDSGLVCEEVQGAGAACFTPVLVRGDVTDLATGNVVTAAHVIAVDPNGAALSDTAITGGSGTYELRIPSRRAADGTPSAVALTLYVEAVGYQPVPGGIRVAPALDTSAAARDASGAWIVDTAATDVALASDPGNTGSISGHVDLPVGVSALVVAEIGGVGHAAPTDRHGDYAILNLGPGDYTVQAYAAGHVHQSQVISLAGGATETVDIAAGTQQPVTVDGSVQLVNTTSSQQSVVLFVKSTFTENPVRGAMPPGLFARDFASTFTIDGVPPGIYVVYPAYDNDDNVRDPDTCTGANPIATITVGSSNVTLSQAMKVTGAMALVAPTDGESVSGGVPTFTWVDEASETSYFLELFDMFGSLEWSKTIAGASGSANLSSTYDGMAALPHNTFHQIRITAMFGASTQCPGTRTEDLHGVFYVP